MSTFLFFWIFFLFSKGEKLSDFIYDYTENKFTSYCSRKLNMSSSVGCSSYPGGSSGTVYIAWNTSSFNEFLKSSRDDLFVLVIPVEIFIHSSLMNALRLKKFVTGVLVIYSDSSTDFPPFSESEMCPNSGWFNNSENECGVTPQWNPQGTSYSSIEWPFPVVLLEDPKGQYIKSIYDCNDRYNIHPVDDTRCSIDINNFMSSVSSSALCRRRLPSPYSLVERTSLCEELTGVNMVLGATNSTVTSAHQTERPPASSLLLLARMDSRSMFERSGFGSKGFLPGLAVLLSVAVHLTKQPAFVNGSLKKDLFFAFLDNEAYDFTGSALFVEYLQHYGIAHYTGHPLQHEHVYGMIELGEIGLPSSESDGQTYYMLSDGKIYNQTTVITDRLVDHFKAASLRFNSTKLIRPKSDVSQLPPTVSLQSLLSNIPVAHLLLTDHQQSPLKNPNFESFLDRQWPPTANPDANSWLLSFANTLADAIHREVTIDSEQMPEPITKLTPGELMECFTIDINCSLLQLYLNPDEREFLLQLDTPIPSQSYISLDGYELKISQVAVFLLMGLTGEPTAESHCSTGDPNYQMGYFNGSAQCYRTRLDLMNDFSTFPWVRSKLASNNRYVRWYRSASPTVEYISLVLGIIMISLTGLFVYLMRHTLCESPVPTMIHPTETIPAPSLIVAT